MKPIVRRTWEMPKSCWTPRERAKSAPPCSRPVPESTTDTVLSEYTSNSCSEVETVDTTIYPNYECECFMLEEEEVVDKKRKYDPMEQRIPLAKYLDNLDTAIEPLSADPDQITEYFKTFKPSRHVNKGEIEKLLELLSEQDFRGISALVVLERMSHKREISDLLCKNFFVPVLQKWTELISKAECPSEFTLDTIISFVENITQTSHHDLWLDDVYKEHIVEHTTTHLAYDGVRARYCSLLLRVFSDSPCCANILANTALPECILLPQVKQTYWEESQEAVYLDEDIFLQEEILKIFCNIAHSSSFGRKVLICHSVIETITRVLAYATCPVQYHAALLVGALCGDVTGCDHVTSILTNQRADNATCVRHLGNLFQHSKCLRVKAASGAALYRLFSTQNRQVAHRGLRIVHDVLFDKPPVQTPNTRTSKRPSTAPSKPSPAPGVTLAVVKDILHKYMGLCTSKGAFADSRYFRCRLMALEAVTTLLHYPLKLEGRGVILHTELAKLFFSFTGERLFQDLKKIAEKHRYVKVLQDRIQKIQINLIKKTQRNTQLSQILNLELEEIESDNSVLRIPSRDFEMARNELVYCENVIKILSVVMMTASSSLNLQPLDTGSLIDSTRRYNSQYTTLQDSLYNKYALSVLTRGSPKTPRSPAPASDTSHLPLVRKLVSFQLVESLVPWLYCVYPPITEKVVRCLSSVFTYSSVHSLTVHCQVSENEDYLNIPDYWSLQPSDVTQYMKSKSVTPKHLTCTEAERPVQLTEPPGSPRPSDFDPVPQTGRRRYRGDVITIPVGRIVKPDIVVEQCTHHIGHLCSGVLTQNLLICNNHKVSRLTAELLRDIAKSVTREQLLCMVDDYLLEKLTEYIILCNGEEDRVLVALDILGTLIDFQPTLGKLYHRVGGLNTLAAKLLTAGSARLKQKLLLIINSLPDDDRWCQMNKVDCEDECKHFDVWHKVTSKWENQDNVSRLMSVEL